MIRKFILSLALLLFGLIYSQHKFLTVPKLSAEDVQSIKSQKYPDAPAEVLYRSIHFRLDYEGNLYKYTVNRVKIYNKDNADDYLSHEIATYDKGQREVLSDLKAYTYNYDNGKVVSTKIQSEEKYRSKENKNYNITKFAFPNVKDGSVVEYSYTVFSPYLGSTPRITIEQDIPVRYVEYLFDTPKPIGYNINYKGNVVPKHRDSGPKYLYGAEYQTYRYAYEDVPPFKEEKYVLNNNNYRTGIKAELNSTYFNNEMKSYALSWNDIRKRLVEHDDFGEQLKKQGMVSDILPADIKNITPTKEKARAILRFVQKNYTWDKSDEVVTDKGVRNLVNTKVGNTAEINLLLLMLLRSADIDANPVVLSTVKNGMLLAYNPSVAQLNFVAASYIDGNQVYLLDATSKESDLNMISPRALNYYGLMLLKNEVKQINVIYPEMSSTVLTVDAKMNPDGTFEGNFKDRDTKLYAMMVNESYLSDKEKFAKSYNDDYKFPHTNVKQGLQNNNDFETSFDFTADNFVDQIGSKLVFNPLLFLYTQNHNFNQTEKRRAPLEFYSGYDRTKKVTITLPDNYTFENIPKSKKFRTEDSGLQYSYIVTQEGNKLTVESTVKVDDSVFPPEYYPAFTQIFNSITSQEAQVVTAVKK